MPRSTTSSQNLKKIDKTTLTASGFLDEICQFFRFIGILQISVLSIFGYKEYDQIVLPLFHTLYVFQKIRRDWRLKPVCYAMLIGGSIFGFGMLAVTAVLITVLLQPTKQTNR